MRVPLNTVLFMVIGAGVAALVIKAQQTAGNVFDSVSDAVDTVATTVATTADTAVSVPVYAIGDAIGLPRTSKIYAAQLMDQYDQAPWYEQAVLSFKISANAQASDYFKWLADRTYRPN